MSATAKTTITESSPERADPQKMAGRLMESEHRCRYWWAAQLADGRAVLDAGCGTGYGTDMIHSAGATRIVGIDISDDAIEHCQSHFAGDFQVADIHRLPFPDDSFDLVVCFEVIEHIDDQRSAIAELHRVTKPTGVLAISSPNRGVYPAGNPHHKHEYKPDELQGDLASHFANVALYRQSPWLTSAVLDDHTTEAVGVENDVALRTIKIGSIAPGDEVFTVALASDAQLPEVKPLMVIGRPFEVGWWEDRVAQLTIDIEEERLRHDLTRRDGERRNADQARALLSVETQLAKARGEIALLRDTHSDLIQWAEKRNTSARMSETSLRRCEQERDDFKNRLHRAEHTIDDITGALSWRITAPLRVIMRLFR